MIILLILFEQMSGVCKCLLLIVCEDIFMVSSQIEEVAYSIYHDNAVAASEDIISFAFI